MARLDNSAVHTLGCIFAGTAETAHQMHSELANSGAATRTEQDLLREVELVAQTMARLGIKLLSHTAPTTN